MDKLQFLVLIMYNSHPLKQYLIASHRITVESHNYTTNIDTNLLEKL